MKAMMNYVRACFCIDDVLDFKDLGKLGMILRNHKCYLVNPPIITSGKWIQQSMAWKILNREWSVRLFQISLKPGTQAMVSFDVDNLAFLPEQKISYFPDDDPLFGAYKDLIRDFIMEIKPFIGVIDYDADLLCGELSRNSFTSWGNYLSNKLLDDWDTDEVKLIPRLVDEYIPIEKMGILTFNHPLGYGSVSEHQIKFWEMIKAHTR